MPSRSPADAHRLAARRDAGGWIPGMSLVDLRAAFERADLLASRVDGRPRGFNLGAVHGPAKQ